MAIPCPMCKEPLGLDLKFILNNPKSGCPHCGTIFNFKINEEIKTSFYSAIKEIESVKKSYQGTVEFK
jgi:phage FluMu protein Com